MKNLILIKHSKKWGLDEKLVEKYCQKYLEEKGFVDNTEVSLSFVGRNKAKQLNIKYRNKDYIPQVLGFPLNREADTDGVVRLGDIVICTEKVKYEAKFLKKTVEQILDEWIEHGIDNLLK